MTQNLESIPEGIWLDPGSTSADGVAIVGHEGFIFLLGGSNHYYEAYSQDKHSAGKEAKGWQSYLANVQAQCERRNIKFLFAVAPNKATVLPELYPRNISAGITPRMACLLSNLEVPAVMPVESFRNFQDRRSIFRRNDSHFGDAGNHLMAHLVLEGFGFPTRPYHEGIFEVAKIKHAGDLGGRFDPKMTETLSRILHPKQDRLLIHTEVPQIGFRGTTVITENPEAPIDKTLVAFGNSFLEKIPGWGMSPILARYFKRFVFSWAAEVDFSLVEQHEADAVLFQTCERFLGEVPE